MHWTRWRRHGDPLHREFAETDWDRFWEKVDASGDCWEWIGGRHPSGSAYFDGTPAHRVSWEWLVGPIPDGLTLDHLCRNPPCVNPDHLEPVTHRENVLRGFSPMAKQARKTHCIHGHPFDDENTYITPRGNRDCKQCARDRKKRYRQEARQ